MDTLEEATTTTTTASKRSGAARRRLKKQREAAALEARIAQLTLAAETPSRLPPELVYRILQLGASVFAPRQSADASVSVDDADRQSFLCTASLVCSLWREEAQKVLWKHTRIRSDVGMKSFMLSTEKARTTSLLVIQPRLGDKTLPPLDGQLCRDVILATRGLQALVVGGLYGAQPEELDPFIFASAEIQGLENLVMHPDIIYGRTSGTQLRHLYFALQNLVLEFVWSSRNSYFPWELAAALLNSTLTSVGLHLFVLERSAAVSWACNAAFRPGAVPNVSALFKPTAINFLRLECQPLVGQPCWEVILAYIKQCKALQELRTDAAWPDLLLALPHPLHTLAIVWATVEKYEAVLEGLQAGWLGLSQLQAVEVESEVEVTEQGVSVEELRRSWEALRDECRRRGIALRGRAPGSS